MSQNHKFKNTHNTFWFSRVGQKALHKSKLLNDLNKTPQMRKSAHHYSKMSLSEASLGLGSLHMSITITLLFESDSYFRRAAASSSFFLCVPKLPFQATTGMVLGLLPNYHGYNKEQARCRSYATLP